MSSLSQYNFHICALKTLRLQHVGLVCPSDISVGSAVAKTTALLSSTVGYYQQRKTKELMYSFSLQWKHEKKDISACECVCFSEWGVWAVCVSVCMCVSMPAIESRAFSCVWLWVDYKGIRISREKRKQTDYTAALVQPKALCCSPESSVHRWSTYQRIQRLEKSPSSRAFWWKYRKCFIPFTWLRC